MKIVFLIFFFAFFNMASFAQNFPGEVTANTYDEYVAVEASVELEEVLDESVDIQSQFPSTIPAETDSEEEETMMVQSDEPSSYESGS